jgi:hypothetical protein
MNRTTTESYEKLCEFAKSFTGIDITKVHGIRKIGYVRIRASIIVAMLRYVGITTTSLGEMMGLDHSTVVHHRQNHTGRYRSDDEYALLYDHIARQLTSMNDAKTEEELGNVLSLIRNTFSG